MAWQDEMVMILRVMVNDLDTPYKYTDARLQTVIVAASNMVEFDCASKFTQDYIGDITALSITPDPTDRVNNTRDDNFVTLTLLKSACFVDNAAAREAARKGGVSIREWNTSIDTRGIFNAFMTIFESDKGWCEQYQESKFIYLAGQSMGVGVFGPFRTIYNAYNASAGYSYSNNELFNNTRR